MNQTSENPDVNPEGEAPKEGHADNGAENAAPEATENDNAAEDAQAADPLLVAQAEIADLKDKLLRAIAETENLRRRGERDKADASNFAITSFARDLLPVGDNLNRAIDSLPEEARDNEAVKPLLDGVEMTSRELMNILERHGIRKVDPMGEKFDHNLHQAMFEAPGTGQPDGTVVQVMQVGYVLKERLLRPAMVGVAKGGNDEKPHESVDTTA